MTPSQPDSEVPSDSPDNAVSPDIAPAGPTLDRALGLVRFLRANCDWDAAQTPGSLIPYLLEEAHETADAIAGGDDAGLQSELGDLLLNLAFQIVLAEARDAFSAEDVVRTLELKMRRRHPHLYGDGARVDWDTLKLRERYRARAGAAEGEEQGEQQSGHGASLLDGISAGLDPLTRAQRVQERVATVGFDWPDVSGALEKVREEVEEVTEQLQGSDADGLEEEIGDLLFAVVNLARLAGLHGTRALMRANIKFTARFEALERMAVSRGIVLGTVSLDVLDAMWDEVKQIGAPDEP